MLAPGTVIDRYELVCHVGDGGMAHVWAARQRGPHGFDKLVALKIIHSRFAEDSSFRRMFVDEARIVSAVDHRNVAHVFDLGDSGGTLYLAMEYVDGDSLFSLLAPEHVAPLPVALRIAADACAGLQAAHDLIDASGRARNVVHRDVCPQNVLIATNGDVKLIDFGVAHARDRTAEATRAGAVKGKARYMAPEQARHETVGSYTDVFGIGATLFRALAGRAPYAADDDVTTMQALVRGDPPMHTLPPEVPKRVADVIHRAIAPDPRRRFGTARELGAALEAVLVDLPRADVARFVNDNLPERAFERRAAIHARGARGQGPATPAPLMDVAALGRAPAPPREEEPPAPGFMDVNALIARARDNPPAASDAERDDGSASTSTASSPPPVKVVHPAKLKSASTSRVAAKLGMAVGAVLATLIAAVLLLPRFARARVIAEAREAGLSITVERVSVGLSGISLRDVTATVPSVPGVRAKIQDALVSPTGSDVRLLGIDLSLDGPRADLETGLGILFAANRRKLAGSPNDARHLSIVGARMTWKDGGESELLAGDIGAEIDSRGAGVEDVKGTVGRFEWKSGAATFGPWSAGFERSATNARVRVMFDPAVPDGPSAFVVTAKGLPTELTVKIPRSSITNLGIKPAALGIPANDATDVQASLHAIVSETERSEFTFDAALWALRPPGLPGAIDVRADGGGTASAGKPFTLEKTSVTVGPFLANVTGTVTPHDGNLRLDAAFKTLPMPCERLVSAEAKRLGTWTATLQALGEATRALRVTGTVNASGLVKFDTASPKEGGVTWLAKETCGVSIFGM